MNEMRTLTWKVIQLGARPVLRRHHFKRPGGGSRFIRNRGHLRQLITCYGSWSGGTGKLSLRAVQRFENHQLWSLPAQEFYLDLRNGDAEDSAVAVGHWLEQQLLPQLEPELDLLELARAYENRPTQYREAQANACIELWELLGHPEEAARVAAQYPHRGDEDPPF